MAGQRTVNVAVIGLGRVGLPTACYFARLGHQVIGYDVDSELLSRLSQGENPLPWEPGVAEWLGSIKYVRTLDEALYHPGISKGLVSDRAYAYVIVPTPKRGSGLSAEYVKSVLDQINISGWSGWVIVGSTLDPRTVTKVCTGPEVLYNPPLIRLGHVIEDLAYPTVGLFGMNTSAGLEVLRELWGWSGVHQVNVREVVGDPLSIAVAKLAINVSLSSRIAWANEIAEMCRAVGASSEKVLEAVGGDARIGSAYLKPGWSPAGPCLPRDLDVWCSLGASPMAVSVKIGHGMARQQVITSTVNWIETRIKLSSIRKKPVIGVLGLVYNPGAADMTLSQGMAIVDACIGRGWPVLGYDPMGGSIVSGVSCATPLVLSDVLDKADVFIIATAWPEFDNLMYGEAKLEATAPVLRLGGVVR